MRSKERFAALPLHVIPYGSHTFGFRFTILGGMQAYCVGRSLVPYEEYLEFVPAPRTVRTEAVNREGVTPAKRFPLSTPFSNSKDAALECDFWKFVLWRNYYLKIESSAPDMVDELGRCEAPNHLRDFVSEYANPSCWSFELRDFLAQNEEKLQRFREINKPDVQGEIFANSANPELRAWAHKRTSALHLRNALEETEIDRRQKRIQTYLKSLIEARMYGQRAKELILWRACPDNDLRAQDRELELAIEAADTALVTATQRLNNWITFVEEAKSRCDVLDKNRPLDIAPPVCTHEGPCTMIRAVSDGDLVVCNNCQIPFVKLTKHD